MVRIGIVNKFEIIRYFSAVALSICIIFGLTTFVGKKRNVLISEIDKIANVQADNLFPYINSNISFFPNTNSVEISKALSQILNSQITIFDNNSGISNDADNNDVDDDINNIGTIDLQENGDSSSISEQEDDSNTAIQDTINGVKIRNQTTYNLNEEKLAEPLEIMKSKNQSSILVLNTHTCESYTSSKKYTYEQEGSYRTTDFKFNVVKVAEELTKLLKKNKFNVIQDKTYHDYPAYSGSYKKALETIEKNLSSNKNIEMVIDIHRDAVGSNLNYAPTVTINGEKVAQLLFVIGTAEGRVRT